MKWMKYDCTLFKNKFETCVLKLTLDTKNLKNSNIINHVFINTKSEVKLSKLAHSIILFRIGLM